MSVSAQTVSGDSAKSAGSPIDNPSPERVGTTLGLAYAVVALASSTAAVVVPAIRDQFDLSLSTGAWVITAYVVALAASAPIYGRIADLIGPRLPITIGLVVMSTGAVLSAVAPTPALLLIARGIVGAGAGAVPVLGPVIIAGRLTEQDRPHALTRMAGLAAVSAAGLLLGAVIADLFSWRVVLALPAFSLLLLVPVRRLAFNVSSGLAGLDIPGAIGVSAVAIGLNLSLQLGANPMIGVIGVITLVLGIGASIVGARSKRAPFIPHGVLRRAATWRIAVAAASIPAGFFSLLIAVPAIFTEELDASRLEIGLWILPSALVGLVVGPAAAQLRKRLAPKQVAGFGLGVASASLATAAVFSSSPFGLAGAFILIGVSFSLGQAGLLGLLTTATPADERGAALAVFMVVFFLGGGIGGTLLTTIGEATSLPVAIAVLATLPAAASISTLLLPDRLLNPA